MENQNETKKKGLNKLLLLTPILAVIVVGVYFLIKLLIPQDVGDFELHTRGRYANFIKDAKVKYEIINGRNIGYLYENVIYEDVSSKREVIETRDDVAMATYFVTLIPKNSNKIVNYQCDILKSEFTREIQNMIKNKDTSFIKDAVKAADAINSVRLKGEDIPLDLSLEDIEIGGALAGGAVEAKGKLGKIGVKTDIGKIANLVVDVGIGSAAGVEQTLNTLLKDKNAKADEFVANLDDVTYYSLMLSFAKKMYVEVSEPLKEDDVIRKLDDVGRKQYQKLKDKYINVTGTANSNNESYIQEKKNLYEEKLKELGIKKIVKKGFNSASIVNAGIGYVRFGMPTYYDANVFNSIYDNGKKYTVYDNEKVELYLFRTDDEFAGKNTSDYRTALANGKISENIEGIIQNIFRDDTVEVFDYEDVEIINQNWCKFKLLSSENYYEVVEFLDVNTEKTSYKTNDEYVFMILKEPIKDDFEYNEDFNKIIESIKKIETIKLGKDLEDIKNMGFIEAKEYLESKGFYNFEISIKKETAGFFGVGAKKSDDIDEITINSHSKFKSDDDIRQDAEIKIIYYNTAKYNETIEKNEMYKKAKEEEARKAEELENQRKLQAERVEKDNRLKNKQILTIDDVGKAKLVAEYSDDTLIEEIDTVKFGKYPQDSRDEEDKQDIEWIVLDRKEGNALLLSKYILDCKSYDNPSITDSEYEEIKDEYSKLVEKLEVKYKEEFDELFEESISEEEFLNVIEMKDDDDAKHFVKLYNKVKVYRDGSKITWSECSLRKWLNEVFINAAFSDTEKELLIKTNIKNFDNFRYKTKGGEPTQDRIFLLSIDDVEKYFNSNIDENNSKLATKGTKYAKTIINYDDSLFIFDSVESVYNGNSTFWLRSPGEEESNASIIVFSGKLLDGGTSVINSYVGVRPAIWVKY